MTAVSRRGALDPFSVLSDGVYSDDLVSVWRRRGRDTDSEPDVVTDHFAIRWHERRLQLSHHLPRHRIDNDLAGLLTAELFTPGWVTGVDVFERLLTGIVLSSAADPVAAWTLFYRNTLRRLEFLQHTGSAAAPGAGASELAHCALAGYAPVYQRALQLAGLGSVLEMGSCFGFLSLQLAMRGNQVTASDVSAGTMALLDRLAPALGLDIHTLTCDAARIPVPDDSADVVCAVHLLEHLSPDDGEAVIVEALRIARNRVIVAVPFEDVPDPTFGHVRTFTERDLSELGQRPGWTSTIGTHHGGWLVLDARS